ncbi:uncharacterized protein PITG_17694 [Phytophthora infestans T30-4]|uniref:Uncharacterized protein n=2 Tax=Phytophthora infestans TaxID=4787 RepID=D0NYG4_PHYIT|nr:uncharacterized protein PITG_17694 [Phytophthora infestans T30-4]EEY68581.1 hypothetical protein PITG_17694 [Phytophthora infestans T30-4]KAF4033848.1 hypothetical protein GN244_ATG14202 [Phytophthora infestans]|eukprot:XP_002997566.1 hypothetical protein PITG_17694 [Phytophthora infestans T30-4]
MMPSCYPEWLQQAGAASGRAQVFSSAPWMLPKLAQASLSPFATLMVSLAAVEMTDETTISNRSTGTGVFFSSMDAPKTRAGVTFPIRDVDGVSGCRRDDR